VLSEVWCSVLRLDEVGTRDNFFALGGDSIRAIEVASRAEAAGLLLTPNQLFRHQTVSELAAAAASVHGANGADRADGAGQDGTAAAPRAEQGEITGPVCLTPIQRSFFAIGDPERDFLAQYVGLVVDADLDPDVIDAALDHLIRHHDLLRARFELRDGAWTQVVVPHRPAPRLRRVAVDVEHGGEDVGAVLDAAAAKEGAELSLSAGCVLRAVLLDRPDARPVLLLTIHHLCVDAVSWRILIEDLDAACRQLAAGTPAPRLPTKTTSFQTWARLLRDLAGSAELAEEARRWRALLPARAPATAPPAPGEVRRVDSRLSRDTTRALLEEAPEAFRTQVNAILLAALGLAFHRWTGSPRVLVDLEGHGREPLFPTADLTRTVGWFTSIYPVPVELPDPGDLEGCLTSVKETVLAVPRRGIGFGLLRRLRADEHGLHDVPAAQVLFNYLGRTDVSGRPGSLFEPVAEPLRAGSPPTRPRSHPIEVVAQILDGRLHVRWLVAPSNGAPGAGDATGDAAALADHFAAALDEIAELARRPDSGALVASDFPHAGVATAELRSLFGTGREIEDVYPLSTVQEGILFHTLAARNNAMYLAQASWELGDVDAATMAAAWQEIARRHPALRTRLMWELVDRPLHVVEREEHLPITLLDWSDRDPAVQAAALDDLIAAGQRRGFELSRAPVFRITLIRTGTAGWRILLESHHILLDGWSTVMLLGDVLAVYQAMVSGDELRLPTRRPFRDYIAWSDGRDAAADREYWTDYLAGFTEPTPLPFACGPADAEPVGTAEPRPAGPRPAEPGPARGGHALHDVALPADFADALREFTRRVHLTQNTVVQSAWGLLLSRYADSPDVVFGATVSGRNGMPDMERMLGLFINTLPVRMRVAGDLRLEDWLREHQADWGRIPSAHVSLGEIAGWSEVPRRTPLFTSNVVFENYPVDEPVRAALGGMSAQALRVEETTNYPLSLVVNPGPPVEIQLLYEPGRFRPAQIDHVGRRLATILTAMVTEPNPSLADLIDPREEAPDGR
jgi:non-ribosomal peptide synthase protein (TIGR01720 family)